MIRRSIDRGRIFIGLYLLFTAALGFYLSSSLRMTTDVGVGPGFMPKAVSLLLFLIGSALVITGLLNEDAEPPAVLKVRPLLTLFAIVFFGATIEWMGLVIALSGLVFISCLAHRGTKVIEAVSLAAFTVAFASLVFVKALGLTMHLLPLGLFG
ncbi:tripartite tricarboxylate transporter TctB family protein [Rhizobium sp. Leaf386]|uniref:tripartite tricarboxylate transporter TctB family protein n=1 Tax=Rhizobium sp. Leaf386 TaxID=1736359 RepID=UPI000712D09D|nr:tripartite tricarboxylate transporter TctB family protein [Rhizobium sp. Leaf386]KQT02772.1 hypothetical protein ASG50_18685 [Rhizobium sp. Leaf386]